MLDGIKNMVQSLREFSFTKEVEKIVEDNREQLADLQAEQLSKGVNSKGEEINPPYTEYTIEQKKLFGKGLGRVTDHVTYYMTGDLYRSLDAKVANGQYNITSNRETFKKMVKRSGVATVGLNEEMRLRFAEEVTLPNTKIVFKEKTGLDIK